MLKGLRVPSDQCFTCLCPCSGASLSKWGVLPHVLCLLSTYLVRRSSGMLADPAVGGMTALSLCSIYSSPTCPPTCTPTIRPFALYFSLYPSISLSSNHSSATHLLIQPSIYPSSIRSPILSHSLTIFPFLSSSRSPLPPSLPSFCPSLSIYCHTVCRNRYLKFVC